MNSRGYIWVGVGCAALAVLVLAIAHSDDGVQDSIASAQASLGVEPERDSDLLANLAALVLFAAAVMLVLIGAIGAGVKVGTRRDDQS